MQLTKEEVNRIWHQILADMAEIIRLRAKQSYPIYIEMYYKGLLPGKAPHDTTEQKESD